MKVLLNIFNFFLILLLLCCRNPLGDLSTDSNHLPSSELSVTNGLVAWYSADSIVGVSHGDRVSAWSDLSGSTNDASQGTLNQQPLYVNASNGINGRASLLFGDSNEFSNIASPSFVFTHRTFFIVHQSLGVSPHTTGPIILQKDGAGTNDYGVDAFAKYTLNYPVGNAVAGTRDYVTETVIVSVIIDTSVISLYVNGAIDVQASHVAASTTGAVVVGGDGGSNALNGEISEVLIYNRALSVKERESVEDYLNYLYSVF